MKTSVRPGKGFLSCTLFLILLVITLPVLSQTKGKDGSENYNSAGFYIPNRYSALASSTSIGAEIITVTDINELSGSYSFSNSSNPYTSDPLGPGDLIMIIQMQGADIATTDDASYGSITNYNNTGKYELRTVVSVSGNSINICPGLDNAYLQSGSSRAQVVRVPRLSSLTVGSSAIITGAAWQGATGGIVAVEVSGNAIIDGTISANEIGFRGGTDLIDQSDEPGITHNYYVTADAVIAASKGESIAGNFDDYNNLLGGSYGRGAPANGGGGGNGHNAGGGGGSNAGINGSLAWNGTGIKNTSTPSWADAWNLEAANFATGISSGGGRGGYSFSSYGEDEDGNIISPDPLVTAPGDVSWYADYRQNIGGFGGRALSYSDDRLFLGGGGGSGDGNDNSSGFGGNGGGIIYLLVNGNMSGTGFITANGQKGFDSNNERIDAAGGGGGGGAILSLVNGTTTGVVIHANGGNGGNQPVVYYEAEGPGGGGGGGYIATTSGSVSVQTYGGLNGSTGSDLMYDFTPNGATMGASGTNITTSFNDIPGCTPLPLKLLSFTATAEQSKVFLQWTTELQENSNRFEIERSSDGKNFFPIATVFATNNTTLINNYNYTDNSLPANKTIIYYRLKMIDTDESFVYSEIRIIRLNNERVPSLFYVYPNPVANDLYVTLPNLWQGQQIVFSLFDITGKLILKTDRRRTSQTERLSFSGISKGTYILRISNGNEIINKKIIRR